SARAELRDFAGDTWAFGRLPRGTPGQPPRPAGIERPLCADDEPVRTATLSLGAMKRSWIILMGGIVLAVAAYFCFYFICTANYQSLERSSEPELAWLKSEFHLSTAEFQKVAEMHEAYLAGCAERCRLIDEKSEQL